MAQSLAEIVRADRQRRQEGTQPQRRAAADSLYVAQGNPRSPTAQALAEEAGKRLGLPPMLVDEAAMEQARVQKNMEALSQAHRTAGWISDPNNAAVAHDQVESLTGIEGLLSVMRSDFAKQYIDGPRQIAGGVYEAIGGSLYGLGLTGERALDRFGLSESARQASRVPGMAFLNAPSFLREVGARNRRAASYLRGEEGSERALSAGVPDFLPRLNYDRGFVGDVEAGLGQIAGQVLMHVGSGGMASLPSMFGQGVTQMDERVQEAQAREGRTEYSAKDDAALAAGGVVTALTEKLGLDAVIGALPAPIRSRLTNKIADIGVAGLTEGLSEAAEGVGQNAIARYVLGEETALLDGSVAYEGGVGATVGSIARALVLTAVPGRQHSIDAQRAERAKGQHETFDAAVQAAVQNPLRERSPERFASFLRDAAEGGSEVYVPAEVVATFFQSNPDLDVWMDEWDIRDQVEEALAAGTDVVFDQATYLAKVAPTAAHAAWSEDLRHGIDGMSKREAADFEATGEERLTGEIDAAIDQAQAEEAQVAPERQVRDAIFSQLREAGYTLDAANAQATVAARTFASLAERNPEVFADAMAAYQDASLTIKQDFPEVIRQSMDRIDAMIEGLRRRSARPTDRRLFGRSMMEFLAQRGGVIDTGGELAALGVDAWHRPSQGGKAFRRRFIRDGAMGGNEFAPDLAALAAVEAGYLPEGSGPNELFAAIRDELAGRPVYSQAFETDLQSKENADALDELERLLADLGIDPTTETDNAKIKAALERAAEPFPGDAAATYDQADFSGPRGQISLAQGRATITLFQSRDLSTFFHEFGHLTLEMLIDVASHPKASAQTKADLQTILDWFSREAGEIITVENLGVDQHELWARGTERYLMEGKAPSLELREVFRTVATWLKRIYSTVLALDAPITDDVRAVMDRLLASDAEIAQARQVSGQETGVDVLRQQGMTDAEAAAYEKAVARARSDAESDLLGRVMGAIRRRVTKEWNDAAEEIRPEITAEVDRMPDIAAIEFITTTRTPLDRETVVAMLGDEAGLSLLPKRVPPLFSATGGQHPDMVAEAAGYRSGQELLNGLMDHAAEKRRLIEAGDKRSVRQARIEERVREALLDRFGDVLNDGSIEQEAIDAIHSERYGDILAMDLAVLARKAGQQPAPIDALRAWARERVGSRPVREARPGRYLRAERSASTAVQKALAAGDRDEAFRQKQAQVINNVLYVEAGRAERFAEAAINRMRKLARGKNPSIHVDYMEQIDAILEQYELKEVSGRTVQRRKSLAAFKEEREKAGETVNIPAEVLASLDKTNLADLTVDELRGLDETVKHLVHLGRMKTKLIVMGEERDLHRVGDEVLERSAYIRDRKISEAPGAQTWLEERRADFDGAVAALRKMQEIARRMDGSDTEGPFHDNLDRPSMEAANKKARLAAAFYTPIKAAVDAIPKEIKARWMDTLSDHPFVNPRTGVPLEGMKRADLIAVALNVGTLSNFESMAKGWGVISSEADAVAVSAARLGMVQWLNDRLDASEWAYVQAWWDAHERLRSEYFAAARKVEGFEPEAVDAEPVTTPAGVLKGGYAPLIYHPDFDEATLQRNQMDDADPLGGLGRSGPRPDNGATISRTGYSGPVDLRMDSHRMAADKHLTYAAYAEFVSNALKFINHRPIREAVITKLGKPVYDTIRPWLESQVRNDTVNDPNAKFWQKILRQSRSNIVMASLLGSVTVMLAQGSGLVASAAKIGPARLARGVAAQIRLNRMTGGDGVFDYVAGKSDFMRLRLEEGELDRDIKFALAKSQSGVKLKAEAATLAGKAIAAVDFYLVSGPTWLGVYESEIEAGRDEADAVYAADMAVSTTQGGGRARDMSGFMRGNDALKMGTIAFGWASAFENMVSGAVFDIRHGQNVGRNVGTLSALFILMPLMDAVMSGDLPAPGDDDEETLANYADWFMRNVVTNVFVGIPFARDLSSWVEREWAGEYTGTIGQTPNGRILSEFTRLYKDIKAAVDDEKDVSHRWPAHVISAVGYSFGIPGTSQAVRATNYGLDVAVGDQNPETALDVVTGVVRGPQEDQR